jgi:hypothetical protein
LLTGELVDTKRGIDVVKSPDFLGDVEALPLDDLRTKRALCDRLDTEYSYYRRQIHGRMDILAFELRRRSGEEDRSLIEALPEILAGPGGEEPAPTGRQITVKLPELPDIGRREIDRILEDDFLAHLPELSGEDLEVIQAQLTEAEHEVSEDRRIVFEAFERLQAELTRRYRDGLADADELLDSV